MSPSMDRVGFLKPTCLRKIPRQATGDVTENLVEDALQTKAYSACAGYSLDPLKNSGGGYEAEHVADVFDQRGWGNQKWISMFVSYSRPVIYIYIYMYSEIHRLKTNNIFTDLTLYQIHTHLGDGPFPSRPESRILNGNHWWFAMKGLFFYSNDCMKHILYTYMHIYTRIYSYYPRKIKMEQKNLSVWLR